MTEKGFLYNAARQCIPEQYRSAIRRGTYDLNDLKNFGIPNLFRYGTFDMFQWVNFELNGNCNYNKCWYCPNSVTTGRNGIMSDDVFNTMITQLSDIGRSGFKGTITPTFFGEPTIYADRLVEKMTMIHDDLPEAELLIHTNGIQLTPELYRQLVAAGVDKFIVTRHPDAPMDNFDALLAQLSTDERANIVDRTLDKIKLWDRRPYITIPPNRVLRLERCPLPSTQLTVAYNGDILLCCSNYDARPIYGNAMDKDISQIWRNERFARDRNNVRRGIFQLPACKLCMGKD